MTRENVAELACVGRLAVHDGLGELVIDPVAEAIAYLDHERSIGNQFLALRAMRAKDRE